MGDVETIQLAQINPNDCDDLQRLKLIYQHSRAVYTGNVQKTTEIERLLDTSAMEMLFEMLLASNSSLEGFKMRLEDAEIAEMFFSSKYNKDSFCRFVQLQAEPSRDCIIELDCSSLDFVLLETSLTAVAKDNDELLRKAFSYFAQRFQQPLEELFVYKVVLEAPPYGLPSKQKPVPNGVLNGQNCQQSPVNLCSFCSQSFDGRAFSFSWLGVRESFSQKQGCRGDKTAIFEPNWAEVRLFLESKNTEAAESFVFKIVEFFTTAAILGTQKGTKAEISVQNFMEAAQNGQNLRLIFLKTPREVPFPNVLQAAVPQQEYQYLHSNELTFKSLSQVTQIFILTQKLLIAEEIDPIEAQKLVNLLQQSQIGPNQPPASITKATLLALMNQFLMDSQISIQSGVDSAEIRCALNEQTEFENLANQILANPPNPQHSVSSRVFLLIQAFAQTGNPIYVYYISRYFQSQSARSKGYLKDAAGVENTVNTARNIAGSLKAEALQAGQISAQSYLKNQIIEQQEVISSLQTQLNARNAEFKQLQQEALQAQSDFEQLRQQYAAQLGSVTSTPQRVKNAVSANVSPAKQALQKFQGSPYIRQQPVQQSSREELLSQMNEEQEREIQMLKEKIQSYESNPGDTGDIQKDLLTVSLQEAGRRLQEQSLNESQLKEQIRILQDQLGQQCNYSTKLQKELREQKAQEPAEYQKILTQTLQQFMFHKDARCLVQQLDSLNQIIQEKDRQLRQFRRDFSLSVKHQTDQFKNLRDLERTAARQEAEQTQNQLSIEVKELREKLSGLERELNQSQKQIAQLTRENTALNAALAGERYAGDSLAAQLSADFQRRISLVEQANETDPVQGSILTANKKLLQQVDELQREVILLKSKQLNNQTAQQGGFQAENDALRAEVARLKADLSFERSVSVQHRIDQIGQQSPRPPKPSQVAQKLAAQRKTIKSKAGSISQFIKENGSLTRGADSQRPTLDGLNALRRVLGNEDVLKGLIPELSQEDNLAARLEVGKEFQLAVLVNLANNFGPECSALGLRREEIVYLIRANLSAFE